MSFKKVRLFFQFIRLKLNMWKSENEALRWAKDTNLELSKEDRKEFRNKVTWKSYKQTNRYWYKDGQNIIIEDLYKFRANKTENK